MHAAVKCAQKSGEFRLPRRKKFVILNQSTLQGGVPRMKQYPRMAALLLALLLALGCTGCG